MPMIFNLYVPADYTFKSYFLPKIQNPALEWFEVDRHRYGVQKKGNNHLVVFLDYGLKQATAKFTQGDGKGSADFFLEEPSEIKLFDHFFRHQKEVAVFSIAYHARMTVLVWKLLMDIADDEKILVEDDEGNLQKGSLLVQELREMLDNG